VEGAGVRTGESGEIIATGFDNYIMPLIRYRMGDRGVFDPDRCPCGRSLPVLQSLEGRTSEVLTVQGKTLFPATLSVVLEGLVAIKECQFIKRAEDHFMLNVVRRDNFDKKDESLLRERLENMIGRNITYTFNYVPTIERTPLGKFILVIDASGGASL